MPTPVYVFSGFLGSGKTTLINHLLDAAPRDARIMVLVNEFGKISVDKRLVRAAADSVVDLSGGCICCGMFFELVASIRYALDTFRADSIWIESTGLAIPQEIFRQALSPAFEGRVRFGGIITVVDPSSFSTKNVSIIKGQTLEADVVVINKVDTARKAEIDAIETQVRSMAPRNAIILRAQQGMVPYPQIFSRHFDDEKIRLRYSGVRPAGFDSTAGFATVALAHNEPIDRSKLVALFKAEGARIVRAKGFIETDQGPAVLQFTANGLELRETEEPLRWSELVLIMRQEDRRRIEARFRELFAKKIGNADEE